MLKTLYDSGVVCITDDRFMSDEWKKRQAFERALPDLNPHLGEAYITGGMEAVWIARAAEGDAQVPNYYQAAFESEFDPYASLYTFSAT